MIRRIMLPNTVQHRRQLIQRKPLPKLRRIDDRVIKLAGKTPEQILNEVRGKKK